MNLNGLAAGTTIPNQRIRPGHLSRPSLQAVYQVLMERPLRLPELTHATGYARRTVSSALRDLEARGLLSSQPDLTDTRHTWYWIVDP